MRNILTLLLLVWAGNLHAQATLSFETVAEFDQPWALAALPNGGFLVTEKLGALKYVSSDGSVSSLLGTPLVLSAGQVGLLDVALAPNFDRSRLIYLTWVEGSRGGALHLGRAELDLGEMSMKNFSTLCSAVPSGGGGHPGSIIAFSPDGYMFLTSGDRQENEPAQILKVARGKIG